MTAVRYTVLVVDDDVQESEGIADVLEFAGYRVITTASARSARAMVEAMRPSLIITDLSMPEMCGAELVERLRADRRLNAVPIVVVTGDADARVPEGAEVLLHKPLGIGTLTSIVQALCPQRG